MAESEIRSLFVELQYGTEEGKSKEGGPPMDELQPYEKQMLKDLSDCEKELLLAAEGEEEDILREPSDSTKYPFIKIRSQFFPPDNNEDLAAAYNEDLQSLVDKSLVKVVEYKANRGQALRLTESGWRVAHALKV